ncbi:MAG TPA: sensor domain-containing diguanylate cyclase [Acidimicrobiales bacterium]|nr:sensor domain-containing diguanylate cyclase [Acidimicrobiales bacterium]
MGEIDGSGSSGEAVDEAAPARTLRRTRLWNVVAVVVLVVGMTLSAIGALEWHGYLQNEARDSFVTHASAVSAAVSTALRRDIDFVATQKAGIVAVPDLSNRELGLWYTAVDIKSRFPGGVGFAFIQRVLPSQLSHFGSEVVADPPVNQAVSAPYTVFPAGLRSEYCLQRFGIVTSAAARVIPPTFDFCSSTIPPGSNPSPIPRLLDLATDSGQTTVLAAGKIAKSGGIADLFVTISPVYSNGETPTSVSGREKSLHGWILATFSGATLLRSETQTGPGLAVSVSFDEPGSGATTIASSGKTPGGGVFASTLRFQADGSWVVRVVGSADSTATAEAVAAGTLGAIVSCLLFLLFALLTRSRALALQLVDKRTKQLRHLALHDPLTDLPNRALILDRAEQMLIRAKRHPLVVGALFIDLDKFKEVNDTFGHATGDQLLKAVGDRLSGALRASDSVGRLGGDEFVVLVEGELGGIGPEVVAQQLLALFAEPFVLGDGKVGPLRITASIGVALGPRSGAADLLRDADVALYVAKARGEHGYVVFRSQMHMDLGVRLGPEWGADGPAAGGRGDAYQRSFDLDDGIVEGVASPVRAPRDEAGHQR